MLKTFPKAALIDMDGTLYDSMGNHAYAWTSMAREMGIDLDPIEIYRFEGRTGASTINELILRQYGRPATDEEKKNLYAIKCRYFNERPPVSMMPGALRLMEALRHAGIKRVLVTGSGQSSLLSRLNTDFPGIFRDELRVTSANVKHGKPHPEPYLIAMEMAGIEPCQAVVFENAPMGVESAARSGAFTVGITTGPLPREELLSAGADIVYDSMEECADLFPRLLYNQSAY